MNQAVNFFWTIICFLPVIACWLIADTLLWCYIFLGISLMSLFIPTRLLQLSASPGFYTRAGVKFFRKFVQNGDHLNRLIRKSQPNYRVIKGRQNAIAYLSTVTMYQKYHLLCLIFFLLSLVHAAINHHYLLAVILAMANIIYNVYPILLQQYNRARVLSLQKGY